MLPRMNRYALQKKHFKIQTWETIQIHFCENWFFVCVCYTDSQHKPACCQVPQTLFNEFDLQRTAGPLPTWQLSVPLSSHCASNLSLKYILRKVCQNKLTREAQPVSKELVSWSWDSFLSGSTSPPASLLGHFLSLSASSESQTHSHRQNNLMETPALRTHTLMRLDKIPHIIFNKLQMSQYHADLCFTL